VEQAARAIHGQRTEDSARLVELLVAIRECFGTEERLQTSDLIGRLLDRSDEPWLTIKRGQPIDAYYLRAMLSGIVKRQQSKMKIGGAMWRGYFRADFADAWARYIPADPVSDPPPSGHPPPEPEKPAEPTAYAVADHQRASATHPPPVADAPPMNGGGGSVADGVSSSATAQAIDTAGEIGGGGGWTDGADGNKASGAYTPSSGNGHAAAPPPRKSRIIRPERPV
jgi:hypothetical protein